MNSKSQSFQWLLLGAGLVIGTLNTEAQQKPNQGVTPHLGAVKENPGGTEGVGHPYFKPVKATVGGSGDAPRPGTPKQSKRAVYRNAAGEATIANGQVTGVTINNRGHYSTDTKLGVVFSGGGGSGATGTVDLRLNGVGMEPASIVWVEVKGVRINNPGTGYTSPPTVTFVVQP